MRPMMFVPCLAVMLLAVSAAGLTIGWGRNGPAQASPALVVGFDMNPAGNSCPGDGVNDCTLGTIDPCIQVADGASFDIDVFVQGLPLDDSILGGEYPINWGPPDFLDVNTQTHASTTVNLLAQRGEPSDALSEEVPDAASPHLVSILDFGAAEYNPPFTRGVLGRYTVTVAAGTAAGTYGLTLGMDNDSDTRVDEDPANGLDDDGDTAVDEDSFDVVLGRDIPPGDSLTVDQVWQASSSPPYGLVAVNTACPAAPSPTPTASPTGTPTTATPTSTVPSTPPPPGLSAGWNHACYLGAELPIAEALGALGTNVVAVYRLRANQGFDRWFPAAPQQVSDITTLGPYEALLILAANSQAWPQSPATAPPTTLNLQEGWNSACYSGQTKEVEAATASIAGQFGVLYSLTADEGWKRFVPARPEISDPFQLPQFAAIFILVTQPGGSQWVFDP